MGEYGTPSTWRGRSLIARPPRWRRSRPRRRRKAYATWRRSCWCGPGSGRRAVGGTSMTFASSSEPRTRRQRWFADGLRRVLLDHGLEETAADQAPRVVLHYVDREAPRPFRRKAQAIFVVAI